MSIDTVMPNKEWKFDEEVTQVFDDMLARSIPQYEVMRRSCYDLACKFHKENSLIVDLGCSRGEAMALLVDRYGARNHFLGLEISPPMIAAARERFKGMIDCRVVEIREFDLRNPEFPFAGASVIQSILTLQFTPIEYRQRIVKNIYNALLPGSVFILVEKVLGHTSDINDVMVDIYYQMKSENGYTQEQILAKKHSLEGVLVPMTAAWNEELLKQTGFREVDCFWRWMNFAGWIAIK